MMHRMISRLAAFVLGVGLASGASANCFNTGTVWCDGVVRNIYVSSGVVFVSLGNSIGGALGCGTVPAPTGAAASEYVTIDPALPQYAEKYQAVLVAGAAVSNVLVYLVPVPSAGNRCGISAILVQQ